MGNTLNKTRRCYWCGKSEAEVEAAGFELRMQWSGRSQHGFACTECLPFPKRRVRVYRTENTLTVVDPVDGQILRAFPYDNAKRLVAFLNEEELAVLNKDDLSLYECANLKY